MAKAKAKSKGKKKGRQAKLSKGKKKARAKTKARKGAKKKKSAPRKRSAPKRVSVPERVPSFVDTSPVVPTFASEAAQEQSMADESPGPEETSYSEIGETDHSSSSM